MRDDLPSGTVTFLFTDVEGSTQLLHELGAEAYAEALAEHRRLLREAFARQGGVEVDTQGDAFFYAFATAPGALDAAREGQEVLADGLVRVRVGIHTGTPHLAEEGYVGGDVHRAARIAAAAHGGQVLVSASTAVLVERDSLRDLGEHRLKDLSTPERIYQLGDEGFPPLKTLSQTNLPIPATPFLGREKELDAVVALILREDVRLLTLTGPGGTGKTRLALQAAGLVADAFGDGAWWVPLAALRDPKLVLPRAAQALGAKLELTAHIADKRMLILLDNLEQVVEAATELPSVLSACPHLRLVVTSRELLRVAGEVEYAVPPLAEREAVELFRARSRIEPDDAITELCRRLDNLPLAVELAAARTRALSPRQILERLSERRDLLRGGRDAEAHQRTLRETIAWSYELLTNEEQRLFACLSVFARSCSLEAAEEVCEADLDTLQSLVDKSLLRHTDESFWMLETIREYAAEQLEAGESRGLRERHAAFFARLADCRWLELFTEGGDWRQVVELEHENLRAALEWSLEQAEAQTALAIGSGVWPFWLGRGYARQARHWLEGALALPAPETERRGHVLAGLGDIATYQGDVEAAEVAFEEALGLFRAYDQPRWIAAILSSLSDLALMRGDHVRARLLAEESVALRREIGSIGIGRGLVGLAEVALAEGDLDQAQAHLDESLASLRGDFSESSFLPNGLEAMGEVARRRGHHERALLLFAEALRLAVPRRDHNQTAMCLEAIAAIWMATGDKDRAARLAASAERIREQSALVPFRPERPLPERVEPAWSQGRSMAFDEAVAYALSELDE